MLEPDRPDPLIDDQAELKELCDSLKDRSLIAVDTEFNRTDTYRPRLCLVQLAADDRVASVDLLADLDIAPLRALLTAERPVKVFHAAKQDQEALYLNCGFVAMPVFDTQIGGGLLGYPPQAGYATLVESLLGIRLEKGETRTDWSRRPLSTAQLSYAADDVRHLPALYAALMERLTGAGRLEWAEEDSAALLDPSQYATAPGEAWQRLPGIRYLPVDQQARARRLAAWRESRAIATDRPRQWILGDKALQAIARADPGDERALAALPDVPAGIARRQGRKIIAELARANRCVAEGRAVFQQEDKPPSPDRARMKTLGAVLRDTADALGIAPEILATRKELTAILRGSKDLRPLSGWRSAVIGEKLLAAL